MKHQGNGLILKVKFDRVTNSKVPLLFLCVLYVIGYIVLGLEIEMPKTYT